ncbi:GNAT family N-acetyltransferase [Streptacidiphilus sp. 4-A2]|nr:GNAT family N-acetyltransferase [Streptacidiphilus sp. 4-A2]
MPQKQNHDKHIAVVRVGEGPALREDEIDGWHRLRTASEEAVEAVEGEKAEGAWEAAGGAGPGEPRAEGPDRKRVAATLGTSMPGGRTLRWLARDADGQAVGRAWLRLPEAGAVPGPARFRIEVHPGHRRQGVGSALLAALRAEAVAEGRPSLLVAAPAGTAAERALTAWGFAPGSELVRLRLRVADCDQAALRATVKAASEGYHLVRWQGVVPADLVAPYTEARNAMADMPGEGAGPARASWDEAWVRAMAEVAATRGDALLTVAALYLDEQGQEAVAGFSEIVLKAGGGPSARQSDTAVVRAHRGRGLGLWVKAAMLQWLLGAHPEVAEVTTVCADSNRHMIAINEQLGFETAGRETEFRLPLG